MPCKAGQGPHLEGRLALASQRAWIRNRTLRENVTFGTQLHDARYADVLKSCSLDIDVASLPAGSDTEIGERGVTLSGGQQQRLSVARCAYAAPDLCILDDPLS